MAEVPPAPKTEIAETECPRPKKAAKPNPPKDTPVITKALQRIKTLQPDIDAQNKKDQELIAKALNLKVSEVENFKIGVDYKYGDPQFNGYKGIFNASKLDGSKRDQIFHVITILDKADEKNIPFFYLLDMHDNLIGKTPIPDGTCGITDLNNAVPVELTGREQVDVADAARSHFSKELLKKGIVIANIDSVMRRAEVESTASVKGGQLLTSFVNRENESGKIDEDKAYSIVKIPLTKDDITNVPAGEQLYWGSNRDCMIVLDKDGKVLGMKFVFGSQPTTVESTFERNIN